MESGLVGLFRTLLIIVVVYYSFRFLMRFIFPIIIRNLGNKQRQGEQKKSTERKRKKEDNLGEYVDYEEIKD